MIHQRQRVLDRMAAGCPGCGLIKFPVCKSCGYCRQCHKTDAPLYLWGEHKVTWTSETSPGDADWRPAEHVVVVPHDEYVEMTRQIHWLQKENARLSARTKRKEISGQGTIET